MLWWWRGLSLLPRRVATCARDAIKLLTPSCPISVTSQEFYLGRFRAGHNPLNNPCGAVDWPSAHHGRCLPRNSPPTAVTPLPPPPKNTARTVGLLDVDFWPYFRARRQTPNHQRTTQFCEREGAKIFA